MSSEDRWRLETCCYCEEVAGGGWPSMCLSVVSGTRAGSRGTKVFSVWSLPATPGPTIRQSAIVWQLSMINQFARDGQDRPRLRPARAGLATALATAYSWGSPPPHLSATPAQCPKFGPHFIWSPESDEFDEVAATLTFGRFSWMEEKSA